LLDSGFPGRNENAMFKKTIAAAIILLIAAGIQTSVASANGSNINNPPPNCLTIFGGAQSASSPVDEFCDAAHEGNSKVEVIFNANQGTAHNPSVHAQSSGAEVEFVAGDLATFLRVSLPNGRVIIREVGKR
jgi:hypothetical protein